ncbi:hypothetical protein [Maridesulfovibrio sp.]|uniref:hypothetical protein n=1 Tax=Maridesulfovibrio sp. TaxID=2795000 RepID=UPI0029C9FFC3|nr:hypothetical protein [Maridesulfovibrio sp.]
MSFLCRNCNSEIVSDGENFSILHCPNNDCDTVYYGCDRYFSMIFEYVEASEIRVGMYIYEPEFDVPHQVVDVKPSTVKNKDIYVALKKWGYILYRSSELVFVHD